jgi:hypothetical protein
LSSLDVEVDDVDRTLVDLKKARFFAWFFAWWTAVVRCLSSLAVEVGDVDRTLVDLKKAQVYAQWKALSWQRQTSQYRQSHSYCHRHLPAHHHHDLVYHHHLYVECAVDGSCRRHGFAMTLDVKGHYQS